METRALGTTGLKVMPLVLGGNVFGWTIDQKQSFEVLDAFVDHGFNAIDTADCYSAWAPGNSTISDWVSPIASIRLASTSRVRPRPRGSARLRPVQPRDTRG